ncbi:MAG: SGNH/GDSL hydrolase family protein [Phycisphaerales bacterium]
MLNWMLWLRLICLAAVGVILAPPEAEPPASKPAAAPAADAKWYEAEIRAFEAADRASPPAPGQVLFIGSSSIRMWTTLKADMEPVPVLNRGFGGSRTADVLEVFDRIVLPYKPSAIVYYCGDNDLGNDNHDSRAVTNGFIAFEKKARAAFPRVQVFYIAIKPSIARWSNWPAMEETNRLVREYCEKTASAKYLDVATPMLAPDGKLDPAMFKGDGLHMTEKGYKIWTEVVRPAAREAWAAGQHAAEKK